MPDDSLQYLVDYFEKIGEPTVIVVFFGDHLPYLGANIERIPRRILLENGNPELWTKQEYE
ncbi:hypothetical protein KHA80_12660 [Anaerobacillus sp. HL2]|nr:hypothetical protein KHA80_12660 [Anaerobacillus sp. HL2]